MPEDIISDAIDKQQFSKTAEIVGQLQALKRARQLQADGGTMANEMPKDEQNTAQDYGQVGTAVHSAVEATPGAIGGLAGGYAAGGAIAAALGEAGGAVMTVNPLVGGAMIAVGGLVGGLAGSGAGDAIKDAFQKATMSQEDYDKLKSDMAYNAAKYPVAHLVGNVAPNLIGMRPSVKGVQEAYATAKGIAEAKNGIEFVNDLAKTEAGKEQVLHLMNVIINTGAQAGQDVTQQLKQGGDFDWLELGGNISAGAIMNKPQEWTSFVGKAIPGPLGEMFQRETMRDRRLSADAQADGIVSRLSELTFNGKLDKAGFDELSRQADAISNKSIPSEIEQPQVEQNPQELTLSKEAVDKMNTAYDGLAEKVSKLEAGGYNDAADAVRAKMEELAQAPTVQDKIRLLNAVSPEHPAVQELHTKLQEHEAVNGKLPETTIDAGEVAKLDKDIGVKVGTQIFNKQAAIEKASPDTITAIESSRSGGWGRVALEGHELDKSQTALFTAAKASGESGVAAKAKANEYAIALSDLERNARYGDEYTGRSNAELNGVIADARGSKYFAAIDGYQKSLVKLAQNNLKRAVEVGDISAEDAKNIASVHKNYVPRTESPTEWNKIGKGRDVSRGATKTKETGEGGKIASQMAPDEALLKQRMAIEGKAESKAMVDSLLKDMREGKPVSKLLEASTEKKDGWTVGVDTYKYTGPDGKEIYLHTKSIELAKAMNGLNKDQIPGVTRAMGSVTRFIAEMAVRKNIGFWGAGLAYDVFGAMQNISRTPIAKLKLEFVKNWLQLYPQTFSSNLELAGKRISPLVKEFMENGGMPGGVMQSAGKTAKSIERVASSKANGGAGELGRKLWEDIGNVNEALMMAPRLAAYKTARDAGMSIQEAVRASHEIGPNYLRKGQAAETVGHYKAFVTASMAGTDSFIKSFYTRDGKFDSGKLVGFMAASMATQMVIRTRNDTVDKAWRDKWDGDKNWVFAIDKTHAITIPMEWAQRPVHLLTSRLVDASNGKGDFKQEDIGKIFTMMQEAYTPFGAHGVSALLPTALEAPVQIAMNENYAGKPIVSAGLLAEIKRGLPEKLAFYNSYGKNFMQQAGIKIADDLDTNFGGKLTPQQAEYFMNSTFGGPAAIVSGGFGANRFYKSMDEQRAASIEQANEMAPFNEEQAKYKQQIEIQRFQEQQRASGLVHELVQMPLSEQKDAINEIAGRDADLAVEIANQLFHRSKNLSKQMERYEAFKKSQG